MYWELPANNFKLNFPKATAHGGFGESSKPLRLCRKERERTELRRNHTQSSRERSCVRKEKDTKSGREARTIWGGEGLCYHWVFKMSIPKIGEEPGCGTLEATAVQEARVARSPPKSWWQGQPLLLGLRPPRMHSPNSFLPTSYSDVPLCWIPSMDDGVSQTHCPRSK